jgi:AcrR family transcriptional regulator
VPKGPTKRRPQTTAALLDAAYEAFAERGFHGASIGEISKRAGLTTGAFYSNYASKEDLLLALFDRHSRQLVERLHSNVELALSTPDPLSTLIGLLAEQAGDDPTWFLVSTEFTLHAIRNPDVAVLLAAHERALRNELVSLLALLLEKTGHETTADLDLLARLVIALREGGLAQSMVEPDALPNGELDRRYLPTILRTIFRDGAP